MATRALNVGNTLLDGGNMEETKTVNQETTVNQEAKTFTQDELNAIVNERLRREREKYVGFDELKEKASRLDELEEQSKSDLQKATEKAEKLEAKLKAMEKSAEVAALKDKVSQESGVPASLLTAETEDALKQQAEAIKAFAATGNAYPVIKDGGEVTKTTKLSTSQQFAEWFNQQSYGG